MNGVIFKKPLKGLLQTVRSDSFGSHLQATPEAVKTDAAVITIDLWHK